ncbi:MAG: hypothetical protein WAW33_01475 [Minisyncoccia bacterium]
MKRFSKIFCVALIVIIFAAIINSNTVSATTTTTTTTPIEGQCNNPNDGSSSIPAAKLLAYDPLTPPDCSGSGYGSGYCYCSSVNLIFDIYKSLFTDPTKQNPRLAVVAIDRELTSAFTSLSYSSQPGKIKDFANAYLRFTAHVPDDAHYSDDINVKSMKELLDSSIGELRTGSSSSIQDSHTETMSNDSRFRNVEEGACEGIIGQDGITIPLTGKWFREVLEMFNCWIIVGIKNIVKLGVELMSALIEPGKFWGKISTNPAVTVGFSASLELVNIVFSVALVVMAIGTILNLKSYKINDLITKFIIVALLINFTLVIAGSIIDLANYLSLFFLNLTLKSSGGGGMVAAWNGIFSGLSTLTNGKDLWALLTGILINIVLLIALLWAFGSIIFSLFKRGFMLIFLLIISPFAVVTSLLPGKGAEQWGKWKTAFLKYTFYGVYVSAGLYIGTIMLQSLCLSLQTETLATNSEMGFMSSLMVPIMAAGFLIYIVLLADELAGGSAKAAASGATKLALGVAGGAALAGAMQAKNAVTTSEWYGKTAGALSTTKGLGWMGNAGLKSRETSLAYRDKQGATVDADVNRRDVETNKSRLKTIATSTDPKLAREKLAIAKQLIAQKKMDKDSAKLLEDNADTIANDNNRRTGWIPAPLKKSFKDSMPSLFIRYDVEKDTGTSEKEVTDIMAKHLDDNGNVNLEATAQALVTANPKLGLEPGNVTLALRKYLDDRAKIGIQFAKNAANANEETLVNAIIDENEVVQGEIMKRLAENPATMRSVMDQISESGLSTPKKQEVIAAFQKYLDNHGSQYTEKQLHYIDENVSRLSTDTARSRKAGKTPVSEALDRENLEKEIEAARVERFTAQDEQAAKQHLDELQKKWNDTYGSNHK